MTTLLAEVVRVDVRVKRVLTDYGAWIGFDTLVIATGARHAYFGHDDWEPFAPGLKTIGDATRLRRDVLMAFEEAERTLDRDERGALLTFVIVGGGPTGVELAGTIAELARDTLGEDFRTFSGRDARVMLIDSGPRILPGFAEGLSAYALRALTRLGVEVRLGHAVTRCGADGLDVGGETIPARTILWAAGVAASPAARWLDAPSDRAGRVLVEPDLAVPGMPDVFVIGDAAHVEWMDGRLVPGVAPAAKQEGRYVARLIRARIAGRTTPPFRYRDAGSLATIGKRAAVVDFGRVRLTGRIAWWLWGAVHIFFLIGLRNLLTVALSWLWTHATGQRGARLITGRGEPADLEASSRPACPNAVASGGASFARE